MSKFQAQTVSLIESLAFPINITDDIDVSVIVRLQCICLQLEERGRTVMHRSIRLPVKSYRFCCIVLSMMANVGSSHTHI
jgi:hypothetical protein